LPPLRVEAKMRVGHVGCGLTPGGEKQDGASLTGSATAEMAGEQRIEGGAR